MRTLGMVASALVVCVATAGSTRAADPAAPRGPVSPSKKPTPIPIILPATTLELANRGGAVGEKVSLSATLRTSARRRGDPGVRGEVPRRRGVCM